MNALVAISRELSARVDGACLPVRSLRLQPARLCARPARGVPRALGAAVPREVVMVGMNPGPFGMAQTGVPFGDVRWCATSSGSTARSANAVARASAAADRRLRVSPLGGERHAVLGLGARPLRHAPSVSSSGSSWRTGARSCSWRSRAQPAPGQAPAGERATALRDLQRRRARGRRRAGAVARRRHRPLRRAARPRRRSGATSEIGSILHPSPASPAANRDWAGTVDAQLRALGVERRLSAPPVDRRADAARDRPALGAEPERHEVHPRARGRATLVRDVRYGLAALIFVGLDARRASGRFASSGGTCGAGLRCGHALR